MFPGQAQSKSLITDLSAHAADAEGRYGGTSRTAVHAGPPPKKRRLLKSRERKAASFWSA